MASDMRVVLFGRTGDGKSTVANALVTGGIEGVIRFPYSDEAVGCTTAIATHSGRGWTVTDTIGLGEAQTGIVSSAEAEDKLTDFLRKVKGDYSHVIFVQKANKITTINELHFLLFRRIFEGAEDAFVILFTSADEQWLQDNKGKLPKYMEGIRTLAVDIPPISDRQLAEKKNREVREQSMRKLEQDLAEMFKMRGNKYSTPIIARMNEKELKEESRAFMDYVRKCIEALFNLDAWERVASQIASLVDLVDQIASIVDRVNHIID